MKRYREKDNLTSASPNKTYSKSEQFEIASTHSRSDTMESDDKRSSITPITHRYRFGYKFARASAEDLVNDTKSTLQPMLKNASDNQEDSKIIEKDDIDSRIETSRPDPSDTLHTNADSLTRDQSIRPPLITSTSMQSIVAPRSNNAPPKMLMNLRSKKPFVSMSRSLNGLKRSEKYKISSSLNDKENCNIISQNEDAISSVTPIEKFAEKFNNKFASERIDGINALLKYRAKASKFNYQARQEEQVQYIRKLKNVLRQFSNEIKELSVSLSILQKSKESEQQKVSEKFAFVEETAQQAIVRAESLLRDNERLLQSNSQLHKENAGLCKQMKDQETLLTERQNAWNLLQTANDDMHNQFQTLQGKYDGQSVQLQSMEMALSDRAQLYEEKKKEIQSFYEEQNKEEDNRKRLEIEVLEKKISKLLNEATSMTKERDMSNERVKSLENDLKTELDRRNQMEMEKCTLKMQQQSLELQIDSAKKDVLEMKAKFTEKEAEISDLVKSLTRIQDFASTTNTKLDTENCELQEKLRKVSETNKELEEGGRYLQSQVKDLQQDLAKATEDKIAAELKAASLVTQIEQTEEKRQNTDKQATINAAICQTLESQLKSMRTEHVAVNAQMEAVKAEMRQVQRSRELREAEYEQQIVALDLKRKEDKARANEEHEKLTEANVSLQSEINTLRDRLSSVRDEDLEELCTVKREAEILRLRLRELSNHGTNTLAEKDQIISELQEKVRYGEKMRRIMHNTIQELRGNVRVFVRARPFLPNEITGPEPPQSSVSCDCDGQSLKIIRPIKGNGADMETKSFTFDKVFAPSSGQDAVFDEVSEFVQSSLDGYHVCLFSYGQTGSGKTHTMQGSGNGQMRGIIPRALEKVLSECDHLRGEGWVYTTRVSFLEIYNESIRDLLATPQTADMNKKLNIKADARGNYYVPDLTMVDVAEMDHIERLMERASRLRSVAATDMNAASSRSHSVFTLYLQGEHESNGIVLDGRLNLVDLAGSERASRSNVSGDRLKETQAINKSLSCLTDVFTAIGSKSSHIPFRNSKLTFLLQNCLSGDGKTLMMVNLSPTIESTNETLCSLRFAKQVNQCELGEAKRQIKSKHDLR